MKIIKKNIKWIIALFCITLFFKITKNIFENDIDKFDTLIYSIISTIIHPTVTAIFKLVTHLGDWIIIVPISIVCLILLNNKKYKLLIVSNLIISFAFNQLLKIIFNRPRPIGNRLIDVSGYSFPSGHSMVSLAFYGLFIYLAYNNIKNSQLRCLICCALTMLILLVGISRIYLGVHYASDVIGGFVFSIAYLILFIHITKEKVQA